MAEAAIRHRTLEANGISMHVAESGAEGAPAVVFLHGGFPGLPLRRARPPWLRRHRRAARRRLLLRLPRRRPARRARHPKGVRGGSRLGRHHRVVPVPVPGGPGHGARQHQRRLHAPRLRPRRRRRRQAHRLHLPLPEDDDAGDAGFDLNEAEHDDGDAGFDLNEPQDDEHAIGQVNQQKHDYSNHVRQQVYQALLMRSKNGKLGKHDTTIVSSQFGVKIRTVQRIWKQGKSQLAHNIPVMVRNLKKGRSGRKPLPIDLENLRDIPLKQRMTIEDVSSRLGISTAMIHRYLKKGLLRRHSSSIKPYLTDDNKKTRLKWCIDMIVQGLGDDPKFKDLFDFVFIDEKWFYISQKSERYYLLPEEDEPHCTCKNKNYIPRLMFLCVCARPRFRNGECVFDGKIGCFPLVTFEHAIRRSGNRLRGAQVIKPITSITRDVIRDFMINKVLPAIRAKWPREDVHKPIFIQQDNAPSHLKVDDPIFCEHAKQDGFDIRLICQPPNSPDFNILDLCFFRAIQAIQYKKNAKTMQDLIAAVQQAFLEYSPWKANRIFVTLQTVLKEAMKTKGCNKIKIPHMNKQRLEREDRLPLQVPCEPYLLAEALAALPA